MTTTATIEQLAAIDPVFFARYYWPQYTAADYHRRIATWLARVARGLCKRLMIFAPPRHGKSMLTSQFFPPWYMGRNPDHHIIATTYAQDLANDFGRNVRNIVSSDFYGTVFPTVSIATDSQAQNRFHVNLGGAYFGVGVGGAITGRGAHLLLIDDPVKGREEAESETIRRRTHEWYASVARTRLMPGGAIVIIQTRWHEDDLAGWILREQSHEGWTILNFPALAEPGDIMGRMEGDALWPEKYPVESLADIKKAVGSREWESLYQQRPSAREGAIFKREWWQYWRGLPPVHSGIIQSWDTAFKDGEENDYSVCTTWMVGRTQYYLLDCWRERVEYPELKKAAQGLAAKWNPNAVLIEDKASGQSLIQELRRNTRLPIIPVEVDKNKINRAYPLTPQWEAGKIAIKEGAPWTQDVIDEMASFPSGAHDDIVDSVTMAVAYIAAHHSGQVIATTGTHTQASSETMRRFAGRESAARIAAGY